MTKTIHDVEELIHLALNASKRNDTDKSIAFLKQAVEQDPDSATAFFLLGAMHAEIGMYERAVKEFSTAIEIDPLQHVARFQLGLLYITMNNLEQATAVWKPLDNLGAEHPLFLFKSGIIQLATNNYEECIDLLEKGIELNRENLPLNKDMSYLIDQAREQVSTFNPCGEINSAIKNEHNHVYLSAYKPEDEK